MFVCISANTKYKFFQNYGKWSQQFTNINIEARKTQTLLWFPSFCQGTPSGLCTLTLTEGSQIVPYSVKKQSRYYQYLLSKLYKTTTIGTTQKWSSWAGGCLIKHLYKTATKQIQPSLAGF